MEFKEVVRRRRMVRHYRPEPVPREVLTRVLEVARRAPSAGFSQGQRFVVVTDERIRQAVAALADEGSYVSRGFDPWLSGAAALVVVCTDETAYQDRYAASDKPGAGPQEWPVSYPLIDCGASLMLLLLAAVDEGLAAGFIGVHRLDGIRDLLGIPPEVTPVGVVTLGYPAADRRSSSLGAGWKPLDSVVRWDRWGVAGAGD